MKKIMFAVAFATFSLSSYAISKVEIKPMKLDKKIIISNEEPKVAESCRTANSVVTGPPGSGISVTVSCTKCSTTDIGAQVLASICATGLANTIASSF